ncbi:MAG TPA: hypothetical protein DDZ88_19980 [Verrucomicrobiales bacterium]|nr:hypothetical protein [Verrucomicrobiales bacterium]
MGLMHSYRFTGADTVGAFGQAATAWALGYVTMAAIFLSARWLVLPATEDHAVKAMPKKP